MPMNNAFMQLIRAMQTGGDPSGLLAAMAQADPRVSRAMQMVNGKSPDQLREIATNMCRERGTTPEQVARSLGMDFPK